jgi:hypothetical protein
MVKRIGGTLGPRVHHGAAVPAHTLMLQALRRLTLYRPLPFSCIL